VGFFISGHTRKQVSATSDNVCYVNFLLLNALGNATL
jgi:hypothetical protein